MQLNPLPRLLLSNVVLIDSSTKQFYCIVEFWKVNNSTYLFVYSLQRNNLNPELNNFS